MIVAVVLTYTAPAEMLRRAVASICVGGGVDLVLVIDNGNQAVHSLSGLDAGVTAVETIVTGRNLGFAGGMNVGIRRALASEADSIVLLNDDVVVEPGWLGSLVSALDGDSSLGGVQPKLLFMDREPPIVNSVGVEVGEDGAGRDIGYGEPDDGRFDEALDVEACTGGAVLLRASMLSQVGGFDERLFMYYEDVDLCRRAALAGWRFRCVPSARVWHHGGASADALPARSAYLRERNRLWMLFRWSPWRVVVRGLWLGLRRVRHAPRRAHARALLVGLGHAPRELVARLPRQRDKTNPR